MSAIAKRLEHIKTLGDLSFREVAQLLSIHPQTVSRWNTGHSNPNPDALNQLLRLEWVLDQLSQLYEADEARFWLFSPHPDLEGKRPCDAIVEDRTDEVLAIIDRLQSSAVI